MEECMGQVRLHTSKKMLLRFSDVDLGKMGIAEHEEFLQFVDSLTEKDELSRGQFNKLFAILCNINDKTEMNYRIYENPLGVFFDVTTHTMGGEDILEEEKERPEHVLRESNIDKIKRYVFEVQQLDLKIDHLVKRKQEIVAKIKPLQDELMALVSDVGSITKAGAVSASDDSGWDLH
jgi:hypothetical protein